MELVPEFIVLINNLENIKKGIVERSGIDYESQDARMVALDSMQSSIAAIGMWINAYNSLQNECNDEKKFLSLVWSDLDIARTQELMFNHLRLGMITLLHFKIDNLFQNILRHLHKLPQNTGYWCLTDAILDICSISKNGKEKKELSALAHIRNSLHSNGIHSNDPLKVDVDGLSFNFVKGGIIECASWEHLIVIIKSNIQILNQILLSDAVSNIKNEIKDNYADNYQKNDV